MEANIIHTKTNNQCITDPFQKYSITKATILHSDSVELRVDKEFFFRVLKIKETKVHNWKSCHENVIELINNWFIED